MDTKPSFAPVILASAKREDCASLQAIVEGTRWRLFPFGSHAEALGALEGATTPVALWDRDLLRPTWQDAMKEIVLVRKGAGIVLLSSVADPYLSDEVVECGGFDVLTRPFRREPVLTTLLFAYTHCTARWPTIPMAGQKA